MKKFIKDNTLFGFTLGVLFSGIVVTIKYGFSNLSVLFLFVIVVSGILSFLCWWVREASEAAL